MTFDTLQFSSVILYWGEKKKLRNKKIIEERERERERGRLFSFISVNDLI